MLLKDVLFIPQIKATLLSMTSLLKHFTITHSENKTKICHNNKVVANATHVNNVITLNNIVAVGNEKVSEVHSVTNHDINRRWHERFCHASYRYISNLKRRLRNCNELDFNVKYVNNKCLDCQLGKIKESNYPTNKRKAKKPFELIHSDVCAMTVPSLGGNNYFVSFIDDFSGYAFVNIIEHKNEVFDAFKRLHKLVKNKFKSNIATLRSDRGGEYLNHNFSNYLIDQGIHHEMSASYTPQQNGVSEAFNRVILQTVRTMLVHSGLPSNLWGEALQTAVYSKNRMSTKSNLNGETPYETLFKTIPNYKRFRTFGTIATVLTKPSTSKLNPRGKTVIMVGYSKVSKAYRLLSLDLKTIQESASVIFNEEVTYKNYLSERESGAHLPAPSTPIAPVKRKPKRPPLPEIKVKRSPPTSDDTDSDSYVSPDPLLSLDPKLSPFRKLRKKVQEHITSTRTSSGRTVKRPTKFKDYLLDPSDATSSSTHLAMSLQTNSPSSYSEAMNCPKKDKWQAAINEELLDMEKREVWEIVDRSKDIKPIKSRWVFAHKTSSNDKEIFRARLVARGFEQKPGIDFSEHELYAPVAMLDSVRILIANACSQKQCLHHVDISKAFLNASLSNDEHLYLEIPDGYNVDSNKILRLKKSLYGLKQSPNIWNTHFSSYLTSLGFKSSEGDDCLFTKTFQNNEILSLVVFVDDILLCCKDESKIHWIKSQLKNKFKLHDLGQIKKFLGIEFQYLPHGIKLHQTEFITKLLDKFGFLDSKSVSTPLPAGTKMSKRQDDEESCDPTLYRSAIGGLLYISNCTRPDLSFSVHYAARFSSDPGLKHWTMIKHLLRYLNSTKNLGLMYMFNNNESSLVCMSDSDFGSSGDDFKSTSGNIVLLNAVPVSWSSVKQPVVALSTCEAELISLVSCSRTALHFKKLSDSLKIPISCPIPMFGDNNAANHIAVNSIKSSRTKHMSIKYCFIRECILNKILTIHRIDSNDNLADILTKCLSPNKFAILREKLHIV